MTHRISLFLAAALLAAPSAVAQATMDIHFGNTGAFQPRSGGGIITNSIDYKSTVQIPFSTPFELGGTGSSRSSSSHIGGGEGHSSTLSGQGGGTSFSMNVIPVPVDPSEVQIRSLPSATGKQLLHILGSEDASSRASALAEIGRRRWPNRVHPPLTKLVARHLADPNWRVAAVAARTMARIGDPSAQGFLVPYLRSEDSDRVIAALKALQTVGTPDCLPQINHLSRKLDLEISTAASRAADAISRRRRLACDR